MGISIVLGQGIVGSTLAWWLHWSGHEVHVVDRNESETASRVAAGLITPVTGKRLAKSADFEEALEIAEDFYTRVEAVCGKRLLDRKPALRIFSDDSERETFLSVRAGQFEKDVELIMDADGRPSGFWMLKAARLRVSDFLTFTRKYFDHLGQYHQVNVDVINDIKVTKEDVTLSTPQLQAKLLFFCQGYQPEENPWFPTVPDAPTRGEILKVHIPSRTETAVVHQGYWLAPVQTNMDDQHLNEYLVGATYDRNHLDAGTTDNGQAELLTGLKKITDGEATVTGHYSGVRAGTRQRKPVLAIHREYPHLAILNGMGSRASLLAPAAARALMEMISDASADRVRQATPISLTKLAHSIHRRAIRPGDTVIDATAGNGHDTLFLSRCTKEEGKVISIDVQSQAIEATRARLLAEDVRNVQLSEEDHKHALNRLFSEGLRVRTIMFNLGYLPGGDKQRTTTAESTTAAILAGLQLLDSGGVMTVIAYRGHHGGREEAEAVQKIAERRISSDISVDVIPGSDKAESPVLYVFRRRGPLEASASPTRQTATER